MKRKVTEEAHVPDVRRVKVQVPVRCGDCLFLKTAGIYRDAKDVIQPCASLGTVSGADPCRWFTPDPRQSGGQMGPALRALASLTRPAAAAAALLSTKRVRRGSGFSLGETAYMHVMGGDYLSNYARGYVIGATPTHAVVEGAAGYVGLILPASLMGEAAWRRKLSELISARRINDPSGGLRRVATSEGAVRLVEYHPPEMVRAGPKATPRKRPAPRGRSVAITING